VPTRPTPPCPDGTGPPVRRRRPRFRLLEQAATPGAARRARTGVFPAWTCRNEVGVSGLRATSFADGGRVFTVTAIIGRAATERTRSATLATLNSLQPLGAGR
jgi:hypothetical protein